MTDWLCSRRARVSCHSIMTASVTNRIKFTDWYWITYQLMSHDVHVPTHIDPDDFWVDCSSCYNDYTHCMLPIELYNRALYTCRCSHQTCTHDTHTHTHTSIIALKVGFHYPSSRPEFTGRVLGPWTRVHFFDTRQIGPSSRVSKNAPEFTAEFGPWTRVVETDLYLRRLCARYIHMSYHALAR